MFALPRFKRLLKRTGRFIPLTVVGAVALPAASFAGPNPPYFEEHASTAGGAFVSYSPGNLQSSYMDPMTGNYAAASTNILTQPLPTLISDAGGTNSGARASSSLTYFITITGPQNILVPLVMHVTGLQTQVSLSGAAGTSAEVGSNAYLTLSSKDLANDSYLFGSNYIATADQRGGGSVTTTSNFVTDTAFQARANQGVIQIDMNTIVVFADNGNNCSGKAHAYLDPYFSFDPSFTDAADYTINVSAGIGNSPVPEPCTLGFMAAGLIALRRRRRSASR